MRRPTSDWSLYTKTGKSVLETLSLVVSIRLALEIRICNNVETTEHGDPPVMIIGNGLSWERLLLALFTNPQKLSGRSRLDFDPRA